MGQFMFDQVKGAIVVYVLSSFSNGGQQ